MKYWGTSVAISGIAMIAYACGGGNGVSCLNMNPGNTTDSDTDNGAKVDSAKSTVPVKAEHASAVADNGLPKTSGWLETRGNKIYHADGRGFHGRGANIHDTRGCDACTWNEPNVQEVKRRINTLVNDWGANFLRLLLESYGQAEGRVNYAGPLDDPKYLRDVVDMVTYIGTKPDVYVLVSLWDDPTINDKGWPTERTIPVWEAIAEALVDQPHVMFGIVNEPMMNFDGAMDSEVWKSMNATVTAIRKVEERHNSPSHLIAVQGTRAWARYLGYYVDHPITAGGGKNIVYETHSYLRPGDFAENWMDPSEKLPVIIGEFGPDDKEMSTQDTIKMMDEAERRDIPWLAWTFHMRCPPNLLKDNSGGSCGKDMALTPTEWGTIIKNRLAEPRKTP